MDQARRLHRTCHRRQQDPQARVPDGRGAGTEGRRGHHAGCNAVEPRAPDGCRGGASSDSRCEILLEDRTGSTESDYRLSGNVLLDRLHGATVTHLPGGSDMDAAMARRADELRVRGRQPYVIPGGGSNPVGALGYVTAALELVEPGQRCRPRHRPADHRDRQHRHAGRPGRRSRRAAAAAFRCSASACARRRPCRRTRCYCAGAAHRRTARYTGRGRPQRRGGEFGLRRRGLRRADRRHVRSARDCVARTEGIVLDPGVLGQGDGGADRPGCAVARSRATKNVVFLHTGGAVGLFGYLHAFAPRLGLA